MAVDPINSEWYNSQKDQPGRSRKRECVELCASPYEYCYDSPIGFIDPTGEQPPQHRQEAVGQRKVVIDERISAEARKMSNESGGRLPQKEPGAPPRNLLRPAALMLIIDLFVSHEDDLTVVEMYNRTQKPQDAPGYTQGFINEMKRKGLAPPSPPKNYKPIGRNDESITLYRGVSSAAIKEMYAAALLGIALPEGLILNYAGTHSDPERHTAGENNSYFTSWTSSEEVARRFALNESTVEVVITATFKKNELIQSNLSKKPPYNYEAEFLYFGVKVGIPHAVTSTNR